MPKDLNFLQNPRGIEVAKEMIKNVAKHPMFIKRTYTDDEVSVCEYDSATV